MRVINDSANMGEDVVILAEEEASDDVIFDDEGNIVEPGETTELDDLLEETSQQEEIVDETSTKE